MKYPFCKNELKDKIEYYSRGETLYKVNICGEVLTYEYRDTLSEEKGNFYCLNCGEDLPIPEEIIKSILKGE